MNIALILAGGVDSAFQMDIPKQFVSVYNRPIIIYTLEKFQNHPDIDGIIVACLDGWQEMVRVYAKQFNITKLQKIITGGKNGQETSYKGVKALETVCQSDDIVILHDSIRPMVSDEIISECIRVCRYRNMGVAAVCSMDAIVKSVDGVVGDKSINRQEIMRIQTPQAYKYDFLLNAHQKALELGIKGQWETCSILSLLGEKIYFSKGSNMNMKVNTVEDVAMFKALYNMKKDEI